MRTTWVWMLLAAIVCCSRVGGQERKVTDYQIFSGDKSVLFDTMVAEMKQADVVFVGENHDDKHAHALQLALLKALHAQNPRLALSMEMFERDVQGVLNEYLAGHITESSFLQASRPWPNYKTDYRPLVEFCRENKLPVVAANAPRRYVNMVSRRGQAALGELPKESKAFLPALPYSMELPEKYGQQLNEIFGGNHAQGTGGTASPSMSQMPSAANMIQAQALWDASMQDSMLRFLKRNRGTQLLQINGGMHSDQRFGIVDRLQKAAPRLKICVVTVKPDAAYPNATADKYRDLADYVVVVPQEKK
jgi:uncharacterized iron-regulated protein